MFLLHGGNYSRSEQLVTPKDAYLTLLLMVKGVCSSNYHYHSCGKKQHYYLTSNKKKKTMHPNKFQMCRMENISLFPPNLKVSDIVTMETIVQSIGTQLTDLQVKISHMTQMPHA